MVNYQIPATETTPEVNLNTKGHLLFRGKSYPENAVDFYEPIRNWLRAYLGSADLADSIDVRFEMEYFNSNSSSLLYDVFALFNEHRHRTQWRIVWVYHPDNEVLQEIGEDFVNDFPELGMVLVASDDSAVDNK